MTDVKLEDAWHTEVYRITADESIDRVAAAKRTFSDQFGVEYGKLRGRLVKNIAPDCVVVAGPIDSYSSDSRNRLNKDGENLSNQSDSGNHLDKSDENRSNPNHPPDDLGKVKNIDIPRSDVKDLIYSLREEKQRRLGLTKDDGIAVTGTREHAEAQAIQKAINMISVELGVEVDP